MGVPIAGWFVMGNPTKIRMILGYPYDSGNLHIILPTITMGLRTGIVDWDYDEIIF